MNQATTPPFNIVLVTPEIPGNTGSIGRTCVALNLRLILIKPYGFDLSEKAVRRAGLDYWKYVNLTEYESIEDFFEHEKPEKSQLHFFSRFSKTPHFQAEFNKGDYLLFGSETKGLPKSFFSNFDDRFITLPQYSKEIRSLNLSNTVTAAAYEGIRQLNFT